MKKMLLLLSLVGLLSACNVSPLYNLPFEHDEMVKQSFLAPDLAQKCVGRWATDNAEPTYVDVTPQDGYIQQSRGAVLGADCLFMYDTQNGTKVKALPLFAVPFYVDSTSYVVTFVNTSALSREHGIDDKIMHMTRPYFFIGKLDFTEKEMIVTLLSFTDKGDNDRFILACQAVEVKDRVVMNEASTIKDFLRKKKYFEKDKMIFKKYDKEFPKITK